MDLLNQNVHGLRWRSLLLTPCKPRKRLLFNKKNTDKMADDLLNGLNQLRKEGTFCDLTLRVGEKMLRVHKNVICASSSYFSAMFSGSLQASNRKEIVLKDKDADFVELLIDYVYTGSLNIDSEKNSFKVLVSGGLEMAFLDFHSIFHKNYYLEMDYEEFQILPRLLKTKNPQDLVQMFIKRWIDYSYATRINFIEELIKDTIASPSCISPDLLKYWKSGEDQGKIAVQNMLSYSPNDPNEQIIVIESLRSCSGMSVKIFTQVKHREIDLLPDGTCNGSYMCNGYYVHTFHWKRWNELLTDSYVYHPIKEMWVPFVSLEQAKAYDLSDSDKINALPKVDFINLCNGKRAFTNPLPYIREPLLAFHENSMYVVEKSGGGVEYRCIYTMDVKDDLKVNWIVKDKPKYNGYLTIEGELVKFLYSRGCPFLDDY